MLLVGKLTERGHEIIQIIVGCFCFAENRGMLPSIELLVFSLNELDVIVIVINRRLFVENVLSLLLFFRFCGGIKRISALTYDCLAV